jgi:ABC-type dipeptide/oligopeptide/nickel transport system permease component
VREYSSLMPLLFQMFNLKDFIMKMNFGNSENSNKNVWKFIIQTVINILAAVLTALGTTSCMGH